MLCKSQAKLLMVEHEEMQRVQKGVGNMNLENEEKRKEEGNNAVYVERPLFEDIMAPKTGLVVVKDSNLNLLETAGNNFDIRADDGPLGREIEDKRLRLSKKSKIIELLPEFKSLAPKPFFFDIAGDQLQYPSVEDRLKELKPEQKGLFGRVKGIFGR